MPVTPNPEVGPFSAGSGQTGVLLIHGFTGNPASLRPLAVDLAESFTVSVPLLPGHGTSWRDMEATSWQDWFAAVDRAYLDLAERVSTVAVLGLSMGGSLALKLAARRPISSVVLVNPSVRTNDPRFLVLPVLSRVVRTLPAIGDDIKRPGVSEHAYDKTPLRSVVELTRLWRSVRDDLPAVTAPLLMFRSRTDHVVDPSSGRLILERIGSRDVTEVVLEESFHVATLDNDAAIIRDRSVDFIHGAVMNDHDIDARFRSLIEVEFGESIEDLVPEADDADVVSEPFRGAPAAEPPDSGRDDSDGGADGVILFTAGPTGPRDWAPTEELDDSDDYKPEPLPPPGRLSSAAWAGIALLVVGAAVILGMLIGWVPRSWGIWSGFGSVSVGALVLFSRLPHDRGPGDGAVV